MLANRHICHRLRSARISAGYKSAADAINYFGWTGSTYRAHENGQNPFKPADAIKYAQAFNVSASWLLTGEENSSRIARISRRELPLPASTSPKPQKGLASAPLNMLGNIDSVDSGLIFIKGRVSGGVWREAPMIKNFDLLNVSHFPCDTQYPSDAQCDYLVEDDSLDDFARAGDFLRCLDARIIPDFPADGDLVVVQRQKDELRETSVRRVRRLGQRIELWPVNSEDDYHSKVLVIDNEELGKV